VGVEHGVLDVPGEIVLDGAGVLAVIGEFEAGRMPEHARMDRHAELGRVAGASNQAYGMWRRSSARCAGDEDM
jgi:hypothetical protein